MSLFDRIIFYLLALIVLSLGPLLYSEMLSHNIKSCERVYVRGNFEYHKAKTLPISPVKLYIGIFRR